MTSHQLELDLEDTEVQFNGRTFDQTCAWARNFVQMAREGNIVASYAGIVHGEIDFSVDKYEIGVYLTDDYDTRTIFYFCVHDLENCWNFLDEVEFKTLVSVDLSDKF
jgi:hypothetical protein